MARYFLVLYFLILSISFSALRAEERYSTCPADLSKKWTNCRGGRVFPDGSRYEGEFLDNRPSGHGVLHWSDGSVYNGQFLAGYPSGSGKIQMSSGETVIGQWTTGVLEGVGVASWPNGEKYVGEFKNNAAAGKGVYIWQDRTIYSSCGDRYGIRYFGHPARRACLRARTCHGRHTV